ncbi:unnamed protein product [Somion occarium]|uniref:Uncharacterized protein n=1 Tax=Somion occarium TaxID=3059160 RepID=A0ABP1DIL1_9APHY
MVALAQGQSHRGAPNTSPLEIRTLEQFHMCEIAPILVVGGNSPYKLQFFFNGVLGKEITLGDTAFQWKVAVGRDVAIDIVAIDIFSRKVSIGPFFSSPSRACIADPAFPFSSIENTDSSLVASSTIPVVPSLTTSSLSSSSSPPFSTLAPSTFSPTPVITDSIDSLSATSSGFSQGNIDSGVSAGGISSKLIGFIVLGAVLFLLLVIATALWVWRRNRRRPTLSTVDLLDESDQSDLEDGLLRTVQMPDGRSTMQTRPSEDRMIGNINDSRLVTKYRQSGESIGTGPKHNRWSSNQDARLAIDSASYLSSRASSPFLISQVSDTLVIDATSSKNRLPVDAASVPHSVSHPGTSLFAQPEAESAGVKSTQRREAEAGIRLNDEETLLPRVWRR